MLQKYINSFRKLRTAVTNGQPAPHKPILLLSVLQTFEITIKDKNKLYITPELVAAFNTNWSLLVTTNHDCRISYPFYYLKSSTFWKLVPKSGFENINLMGSIMKSFNNLNAAVEYAEIADDLALLMLDNTSNNVLQHCLLDTYFPYTKANYGKSLEGQLKLFDELEGKIMKEDAAVYQKEITTLVENQNEEEIFIRGSLFKREIPKIYDNTCCISGLKINALINVSMVDACHIVPFSESYNDTITNGIALCPNLHRAFDRGLITIDNDYKVKLSTVFQEVDSDYGFKKFEGKIIRLPKHKEHYPLMENLNWHREKVFK